MSRSLVAFLLTASFGILFVGCSPPEPEKSFEEFTFTAEDLERVQEIADLSLGNSGSNPLTPTLTTMSGELLTTEAMPPVDAAAKGRFDALRAETTAGAGNMYRVSNPFLNVRSAMNVSSTQVARLEQGEALEVVEIPNAAWAKVKLANGSEGYVAFRYISKLTTEEKLSEEKKKFEGQYFVNFQFLNVRKESSSQAEKLGELPGDAIVKPIHISGEWARVPFEGREGYVSSTYLEPFLPSFLVRQESYQVPILRYRANESGAIEALGGHMAALKAGGKRIVTLRSLYDLVLAQETRDERVLPGTVVLTITGVDGSNIGAVSQALNAANVSATIFVSTKNIGLSGVTEKMALTLMANGNELQAAAHTGDDLRSLTDSQVELELRQSKKLIEDLTHKEVYAVAYPGGGVNDRVASKAADAGYLFGLGEVPEKKFTRGQFLRLPSIGIGSALNGEDVVRLAE